MSKTPEISIIVPVYKVEEYLPQCLDSIKAQTFTDWECILVDDGSPDASGAICDGYAARDPRFRVVHRKNGGLSAARNSALEIARGPFITFVDSDDWIEPDFLKCLYGLIKKYEADMAQVGFRNVYRDFSRPKSLVREPKILNREEMIRELFRDRALPNYMWNKLFRREVINAPFPEGRKFEDIYTFNNWVSDIRKAVLAPDIMYNYRRRAGSIVNTDFSKSRLDYVEACLERASLLSGISPGAMTSPQLAAYKWTALINAAKTIARNEMDEQQRRDGIERISALCHPLDAPPLGELGPKKWWRALLLRDHPRFFSKLMRGVHKGDIQSHHRSKSLFR